MYRRKPLTSRPFASTSFCRTARLIPYWCSASTSSYAAGDTRFMSTGFMIRCLTGPKSIAIRAGSYDIEWHNVGACLWRPPPTYQNRPGSLGSSDFDGWNGKAAVLPIVPAAAPSFNRQEYFELYPLARDSGAGDRPNDIDVWELHVGTYKWGIWLMIPRKFCTNH